MTWHPELWPIYLGAALTILGKLAVIVYCIASNEGAEDDDE
jgi:hypothetical protein